MGLKLRNQQQSDKWPGYQNNSSYRPVKKQNANRPQPKKRQRLYLLWLFIILVIAIGSYFYFIHQPEIASTVTTVTHKIDPIKKAPETPKTPQRDVQLEKILSNWATTHPNNSWSISVMGLGSDLRYGEYKPTKVYASASIYKLFLMYPLFQKITLGEAKTQKLSVSGYSRTIYDCATLALKISDNPCGHAIGAYVGWSNADVQLHKLGFNSTNLSAPGGSQTNAEDTAKFLKRLYNDELFDKPTKDFIISAMLHGTWRDGIAAGCKGCTVANKVGDLGVRHDAAIVQYKGDSYVLVIFTSGASYAQIAQLTSQIQAHMSHT